MNYSKWIIHKFFVWSLVWLGLTGCSRVMEIATQTTSVVTPVIIPTSSASLETVLPSLPIQPSNPRVDIRLSNQRLLVGENLTITVAVTDIGLPNYYLYLSDSGASEPMVIGRVTHDNIMTFADNQNLNAPIFELISARGDPKNAEFNLAARSGGVVQLWVNVTGEVRNSEGAWLWGGGESGLISVEVIETQP
jgi:hypothetical protein